jgi:hypothetical protein
MNTQANEIRPLTSDELDVVSGGLEQWEVAIPFKNGITIYVVANKDAYAVYRI